MENDNDFKPDCQAVQKMGVIYLITNLLNGKKYVGQTIQKLRRRMSRHRNSKSNSGVDAAIRKYGWENFKYEVIEECPVELLNEREIYYIAFYDCKAPKGYNLTDGGEGVKGLKGEKNPFYGKHHTAESKAKIIAHLPDMSGENNPFYGKHHTAESKAKISANHADFRGEKSPNYGKHLSKETRDKISESKSGKNHPNYGKHLPKETRDKISASRMGEKNPNYGKHRKHTEETRARISAAVKAAWAKKKAEKNLENLENQNE